MGDETEAQQPARGDRRRFYVVWSPQGGDPIVRYETFGRAGQAAWRLSEKYPGQDFFVLASCWGRMARRMARAKGPAVEGETGDDGESVDPPRLFQGGKEIAVANEVLDKALPRWNLERTE